MKNKSVIPNLTKNNLNKINNNIFKLNTTKNKKTKGIKSASSKIIKIIKKYSNNDQNNFLKNLKKRKKLTEKYVPKNEKIKSYINLDYYLNDEKEELDNNMNKKNIDSIPIIERILYIQKRIEKNNAKIKSLSEENKLFHKRYDLAVLLQQKGKKKNLINLKENIDDDNNFFYRSILLSNEDVNINDIKGEINIKECKEDLKIIKNLKNNYNEGKNIEYPFYIINRINEEEKKQLDISEIQKEIEKTKKTISDFEKNGYNSDGLDFDKERKKNFELFKKKIKNININKDKNKSLLNRPLSLSVYDKKGTYKLVTKCNINNKNNNKNINNKLYNKRKILSNNGIKFRLFDFYNEYNRIKKLFGPTSKSKSSSAKFVLNSKNENKKHFIDKNKFYLDENKFYSLLNLSLDTKSELNEKNDKSFDINNLYSYLKYNNSEKVNDLFGKYLKKYNIKYNINLNVKENGIKLNPIVNSVRKNTSKYDISNKMKILDNSKYIDLDLFRNLKRKKIINKIKKFDENLENVAFDTVEGILDLNQDLIS